MPFKDPQKQKEYLKEYYEKNKDSLSKLSKENPNRKKNNITYYIKNKEILNEKSKNWNDNNKEYKKVLARKYYLENKKSLDEKSNNYQKKRRKNDILFNIKLRMRCLISNSFSRNGYKKLSKTENIIGCSFDEFKNHIESKFESWMTWDNYGKYNGELYYGWDIDHIIPISSAINEESVISLNHYTNLQPLCSKVNRDIKINKLDYAHC
jgi:hypothetical protein